MEDEKAPARIAQKALVGLVLHQQATGQFADRDLDGRVSETHQHLRLGGCLQSVTQLSMMVVPEPSNARSRGWNTRCYAVERCGFPLLPYV